MPAIYVVHCTSRTDKSKQMFTASQIANVAAATQNCLANVNLADLEAEADAILARHDATPAARRLTPAQARMIADMKAIFANPGNIKTQQDGLYAVQVNRSGHKVADCLIKLGLVVEVKLPSNVTRFLSFPK